MITPKINIGTEAFINYIIKKLAKEIPYEETQVKDSSKYEEFKINLIEK